jgi:hypothetical protein
MRNKTFGKEMQFMRQHHLLLFLFVMIICPVMAGRTAEIAKYAGEFMSTGVGARGLGMGSAYVAVAGDVTDGYWNPAALSSIQFPEIAGMHSRRFEGIVNYDYLGVAAPFRKVESFGLTLIRTAVDDIPITALPRPDLAEDAYYYDKDGNQAANRPYVAKYVNDAEYAFYLSYARSHSSRLSYGTNIKFVRKGVGDNSAWGIGFDIAALWNPFSSLWMGFNFQDATTTLLAWNTGTRELISPTLKTGAALPFKINFMQSRVLLATDTDIRFEGRQIAAQSHLGAVSFDFHAGCELLLRRVVALRIGSDTGHLTAGAGIKLPHVNLDYAFLGHDQLGATHRVSVRVRIEENKYARK